MIEVRDGSWDVLKSRRAGIWGPGAPGYVDELVQACPAVAAGTPRRGVGLNDDPTDAGEDDCETFYYALQDANYNVLGLIESDGDLVERYEYTPYGQRTIFKSAGSDDPLCTAGILESQRVVISSVKQPYGLCDVGHQRLLHDKETGLIHNRARTLHPRLGRFLQRDPLGYVDGMSLYEYIGSAPVDAVDAEGLWQLVRRTIWVSDDSTKRESLRDLVKEVGKKEGRTDPAFLLNALCISPVHEGVPAHVQKEMRAAWAGQKAAYCGTYETGNFASGDGAWSAPGTTLTVRVALDSDIRWIRPGTNLNDASVRARWEQFLARARRFQRERRPGPVPGAENFAVRWGASEVLSAIYGIPLGSPRNLEALFGYATPDSLRAQIRTASQWGATPLRHLTIIGHGAWSAEGVGFRSGRNSVSPETVFPKHLRGRTGYDDALQKHFKHPVCYFHREARVRIVGCKTINSAREWALLLRRGARAYGTTEDIWTHQRRVRDRRGRLVRVLWGADFERRSEPENWVRTPGELHAMRRGRRRFWHEQAGIR